jgi:hypothetical protein
MCLDDSEAPRKKFRREKIENLLDAWEPQKIKIGEKEFDQVGLFISIIPITSPPPISPGHCSSY